MKMNIQEAILFQNGMFAFGYQCYQSTFITVGVKHFYYHLPLWRLFLKSDVLHHRDLVRYLCELHWLIFFYKISGVFILLAKASSREYYY